MARAATKNDLIRDADRQFDKLWQLIDTLILEKQNADFNFDEDFLDKQKETHWRRDKNIRDVLIHLYEWHQLLLNWIITNQSGIGKPFLPQSYNWKNYPQMNVMFWEQHQKTSLEESKTLLLESHKKVIELINTFSNDELFTKKYFSWTGTTSLGSYCVSTTASHYDWAIKKLKKYITI